MITALTIVAAILGASLLIVLHEAGHMWAARLSGMRVERFSVGFGPVIWSVKRGETEYAVSALPLGGYVHIAGMAPGEGDGDPRAFSGQPLWRRAAVLAAGPGANYLAAVVLSALLFATVGMLLPDGSARVGELVPGWPAEQAGLRPGDRVVSVGGAPVARWEELVAAVEAAPGREVAVEVRRGGDGPLEALRLVPRAEGRVGKAGVTPHLEAVRLGPAAAVLAGVRATNAQFTGTLAALWRMVKREQKGGVSGPAEIVRQLANAAEKGAREFLSLLWNISVALALFNLLPVPALDGGRLVFLGVELVTRRKVNARVEQWVNAAGFVALIALLLGVTVFGDLPRLLGR